MAQGAGLVVAAAAVVAAVIYVVFWPLSDLIARHDVGTITGSKRGPPSLPPKALPPVRRSPPRPPYQPTPKRRPPPGRHDRCRPNAAAHRLVRGGLAILGPLTGRLTYAVRGIQGVPSDVGETYECVYRLLRRGDEMPFDGGWITGKGAEPGAAAPSG
jgi:hypothetical protein